MPYIANTPESSPGLFRSDSRHPQSTCKGITSEGRPCKRNLTAASIRAQNAGQYLSPEELYCWQHKPQANPIISPTIRASGSVETLVQRLRLGERNSSKKIATWDETKKPSKPPIKDRKVSELRPPPSSRRFCCISFDNDYDNRIEIVRHKERMQRHDREKRPSNNDQQQGSQSSAFHALIPKDLPVHVKAQLHAEISKPLPEDDDNGYIYVYRKVPIKAMRSRPDAEVDGKHSIDLSDWSVRNVGDQSKVLIKIGYTSNVQRRLSTWSGKCRSQIELLRYYPHTSSSSRDHVPRKTPYCRRVERLVHIELGHKRVKQECVCGSVHREWFEIDARIEAIRYIDEIIKRWIQWAENQKGLTPR